jgi:2-methylcitrate dehydratase PrpD
MRQGAGQGARQDARPVGASAHLGAFVAGCGWGDVEAQAHAGKRAMLNFLATALCAAHDPAVDAAIRVLAAQGGRPVATLIGRAERLNAPDAAFVNAVSANLLDYDDTHLRTVIHPTAPVLASVLALAEERGASGRAALAAFILGVEVECRIGNAVSPRHYARGWHITSTCGVFGAAAACARLLGLDGRRTGHAIGIAASQSSGLVENLPTAAKNVSVGGAARNGLFAALLAAEGYEAAPLALEGPLGWARAMGDVPALDALCGALGQTWEIAENSYKPYPAGIVFHAVIDACLALRAVIGDPSGIACVVASGSQLFLDRGERPVLSARDARVSIHHCTAVALLRGRAGVAEFAEETVFAPDLVALREKVVARLDASLPDGAARVVVEMRSGERHERLVMHARGSAEQPLSDADLEDKLVACARIGGVQGDMRPLVDAVWSLDAAPDVMALLATAARHPPT